MVLVNKLLLILFVTISFSTWSQPFKVNFPANEILLDSIVTIKATSSNQPYNIVVHIDYEDSSFLIIREEKSLDTLNMISLSPDEQWDIPETYILFEFKDMNLDGFDDLRVLRGIDWRYWGKEYDIWLFNNEKQNFNFSDDFTFNIYSDYRIDEKEKTIITNWYGWSDHNEYGTDTYKINGKNLILIERVNQKYEDENKYIWQREKLINGKMKVVEQKFKNENDEEIKKEE